MRLGAGVAGQHMNACYRENMDKATILGALNALFSDYAPKRREGEHFGNFIVRIGIVEPLARRIPLEPVA